MSIIAKAGESKTFTPHPPGLHQMVCCDVIDLGMRETQYGLKHKVDIRWQSEEVDSTVEGHRLTVQKRYTLSLHEKAKLRQDLQSWRGKPFTDVELRGFDLETLIGVNAMVNVVHEPGIAPVRYMAPLMPGKIWANVASLSPVPAKFAKMKVDKTYIRVIDRTDTPEPDEVPYDEAPPF